MPSALFVSQCHHFSPVIYFIAISLSLAPPRASTFATTFFTCPPTLPTPRRADPRPFPASLPRLRTPSLQTLRHEATQFCSPSLSSALYYTFLSLFSLLPRAPSSLLPALSSPLRAVAGDLIPSSARCLFRPSHGHSVSLPSVSFPRTHRRVSNLFSLQILSLSLFLLFSSSGPHGGQGRKRIDRP